ncbi:MAG: type II toxin-antitoxin system HicB family antitoxin [Candidatus Helarchaeota archaeon]
MYFLKFKVILEENEDGGYTISVPSLPGCVSEGNTKNEALKNIKEAIQLYLEPNIEDFSSKSNIQILEVSI